MFHFPLGNFFSLALLRYLYLSSDCPLSSRSQTCGYTQHTEEETHTDRQKLKRKNTHREREEAHTIEKFTHTHTHRYIYTDTVGPISGCCQQGDRG